MFWSFIRFLVELVCVGDFYTHHRQVFPLVAMSHVLPCQLEKAFFYFVPCRSSIFFKQVKVPALVLDRVFLSCILRLCEGIRSKQGLQVTEGVSSS